MSTTARQLVEDLHSLRAERDVLKAQLQVERDNHAATRVCLQADISSLEMRLKEALKERNEARNEVKRLEIKLSDATRQLERANEVRRANTTPEPSRLEIAARIMHGWAANPNMEALAADPGERPSNAALRIADALIAAAKEVQA